MNQNQNPFIAWFVELANRFATKSPKFFKVLQFVSGAVTAIAGIPALFAIYNIPLPEAFTFFQNKYAGAIALGMFIISLLPTQSKIVGMDEAGSPLKSTNEKALPFTAQQEEKKMDEKPVEVLTPDPTATENPISKRNKP